MSEIFKIEGVSKVYGETKETLVHALNAVDFKIEEGEFTAIVGPSGSGKSTLLNILSGLDTVSSGRVFLKGQLISQMNDTQLSEFRRDHIGFIFQSYNLIPVLTVKENIEYVMLLQGVDQDTRRKRVDEILKEVNLEGKQDRFPNQLSGGQQQRVAVARAMVSRPDIILADEPTANLDSHTGAELVNMMKRLNKSHGITFVFSTHDPIIMERAKKIVVLKDGKIDQEKIQTS